ncbi:MAG TPA: radical SAM protein [Thermodesulfovibrionales bacterium]|nr:radical SAM protein [Thermodesulfovibrionales bacterium]
MRRHHGFWDIPLNYITRERTTLIFEQGELLVKNGRHPVRLKPVWKGDLEFLGYSMLHVSLWDFSKDAPVQLRMKSSQHVIRHGKRDLLLEHISFPTTQRCNLNCLMCMRHIPENWNATDVSPEVLLSVFDASPFVHSVSIFGIGEPLVYENLFGVIEELKKRMPEDSQVGFNTNGTLMTRRAASRIIDLGVNWLTFSVDGATKSIYERIRIGADFDKTIENIAHTVEYRNASGQEKLWLQANYVIQTENVHEIPAFVELAGSLGLDSVIFSHLKDYRSGEFCVFGEEVLGPLFEEAARIGKKCGVRMIFPRLRPLDESRCMFMQAAYLWLSGEVVPCCRMLKGAYPGPIRTFGNVRKKSLLDIWNSTEYREFRQRVLARDFPEECKGCSYASGLLLLNQ